MRRMIRHPYFPGLFGVVLGLVVYFAVSADSGAPVILAAGSYLIGVDSGIDHWKRSNRKER